MFADHTYMVRHLFKQTWAKLPGCSATQIEYTQKIMIRLCEIEDKTIYRLFLFPRDNISANLLGRRMSKMTNTTWAQWLWIIRCAVIET